jgi:hypothetical protein
MKQEDFELAFVLFLSVAGAIGFGLWQGSRGAGIVAFYVLFGWLWLRRAG